LTRSLVHASLVPHSTFRIARTSWIQERNPLSLPTQGKWWFIGGSWTIRLVVQLRRRPGRLRRYGLPGKSRAMFIGRLGSSLESGIVRVAGTGRVKPPGAGVGFPGMRAGFERTDLRRRIISDIFQSRDVSHRQGFVFWPSKLGGNRDIRSPGNGGGRP
jgi:hypothetical protein